MIIQFSTEKGVGRTAPFFCCAFLQPEYTLFVVAIVGFIGYNGKRYSVSSKPSSLKTKLGRIQ